jgi:hypothetical protein
LFSFGIASEDDKLVKRAARFGISNGAGGGTVTDPELAEKRRQRAERFGIPVETAAASTATKMTSEEVFFLRVRHFPHLLCCRWKRKSNNVPNASAQRRAKPSCRSVPRDSATTTDRRIPRFAHFLSSA